MLLEEQPGKVCPGCDTWKPRDAFPKNARKKDGLHFYCKVCHSERTKKHIQAIYTQEWKRAANVKYNYGLSSKEYQVLAQAQGGLCAACGQPETKLDSRTSQLKNLHVDHDHATGRVRALLCHACNSALGLLGDDLGRIRLLLAYAERHQGSQDE